MKQKLKPILLVAITLIAIVSYIVFKKNVHVFLFGNYSELVTNEYSFLSFEPVESEDFFNKVGNINTYTPIVFNWNFTIKEDAINPQEEIITLQESFKSDKLDISDSIETELNNQMSVDIYLSGSLTEIKENVSKLKESNIVNVVNITKGKFKVNTSEDVEFTVNVFEGSGLFDYVEQTEVHYGPNNLN